MAVLNFTVSKDKNSQPLADPLAMFRIYREDTSGDPQYSQLVYIGAWAMMKINSSAQTVHWCGGTAAGVDAAWTGRASLDYVPYDVFLKTFLGA